MQLGDSVLHTDKTYRRRITRDLDGLADNAGHCLASETCDDGAIPTITLQYYVVFREVCDVGSSLRNDDLL